jgi:hypothetical protein
MVSGGAPAVGATLQQGLPLRAKRSAAGQFWTFTMSNSKRKQRVVSRNRETQVHDARTKFGNSRFFQTCMRSRSCVPECARLSSVRTCVRSLPFARTCVRTSRIDPAQDRGSQARPASLTLRRASARCSARREDRVIRRRRDNDHARANDWRPQRVVRQSPRQQIGSVTCGAFADHVVPPACSAEGSARRRLIRFQMESGLLMG